MRGHAAHVSRGGRRLDAQFRERGSQSEFGGAVDFPRIASFMERQELNEGEFLFRQGEAAESRSCCRPRAAVAITIIDEHGRPIRLRRMVGHTVVGEMGFYRGVPRTASVIAEEPTVIYRLTRDGVRPDAGERPGRGRRPAQADHQAACRTGSNSPIAKSRPCSRTRRISTATMPR